MPSRASPLSKLPLRLVFARNIRLVRVAAGMSQERMAAEAGLDRAFVGTLERGQRNISIDNIELLAKAVDATGFGQRKPWFERDEPSCIPLSG